MAPFRTALLALLAFTLNAPALGQDAPAVLPSAPLDPSPEDCRLLDRQYFVLVAEAHENRSICMRQQPDFGWGRNCSGAPTMRAWSQCENIAQHLCRLQASRREEVRQCQASAGTRAEEGGDGPGRRSEAEAAYARAQTVVIVLQDPRSFLRRRLAPYPGALDRLFGVERAGFDSALAQEVYRYAHNQAVAGSGVSANPIVRELQFGALDHLAGIYAQTIRELNSLSARISQFRATHRPSSRASSGAKPVDPYAACAAQTGEAFMVCVDETVRGVR